MAAHNELGKKGELYAKDYLIAKGYKIRDLNWRSGHFELDIVAENDDLLVVVEVKTRRSNYFGRPEEAVNEAKIKRTIDAVHRYIHSHKLETGARCDIISILIRSENDYEIEHIEDAFRPSWR
ncbi:MAG: YraN family protein [Prevotellaceae bacterium]|jgi:putative endonuclease|nr:YraN family protein [Prevotellaceae bacterium]